ncbi:hypothetical protein NDU88_001764 [Pleurodeles waltl]|uniref:Uncharacterized protein n=1 Tax=Pleurodeles waltl TaxID=8319 RepID=A0AAV7T0M5_PLEWA|nr:hypothetical protein NDU88_001764 [Pleurodeles waltl]
MSEELKTPMPVEDERAGEEEEEDGDFEELCLARKTEEDEEVAAEEQSTEAAPGGRAKDPATVLEKCGTTRDVTGRKGVCQEIIEGTVVEGESAKRRRNPQKGQENEQKKLHAQRVNHKEETGTEVQRHRVLAKTETRERERKEASNLQYREEEEEREQDGRETEE